MGKAYGGVIIRTKQDSNGNRLWGILVFMNTVWKFFDLEGRTIESVESAELIGGEIRLLHPMTVTRREFNRYSKLGEDA